MKLTWMSVSWAAAIGMEQKGVLTFMEDTNANANLGLLEKNVKLIKMNVV